VIEAVHKRVVVPVWAYIQFDNHTLARNDFNLLMAVAYNKNSMADLPASGDLTGRLASRYSATSQTNRLIKTEPIRRRTQRAFSKPRSIPRAGCERFSPNRFIPLPVSEMPAQCEGHPNGLMLKVR
jgi:hypothetical protein